MSTWNQAGNEHVGMRLVMSTWNEAGNEHMESSWY